MKLRSLVSIHKESDHKLDWIDVDKQIYDEDSSKSICLKLFGIRVWRHYAHTVSKHQVMKNGKSVGFVTSEDRK